MENKMREIFGTKVSITEKGKKGFIKIDFYSETELERLVELIKSIEKKIDGFGTLMQNFKADKYHGKKIRMTGYMRSKKVKSWAGFWLRVDGNEIKKSLAFDNMYKRAIKGTTDWNKYEIILEVSEKATKIAFGAMLHGTGQIWFDKIDFEVVDNSVPTTNMLDDMNKDEPQNLNFNK